MFTFPTQVDLSEFSQSLNLGELVKNIIREYQLEELQNERVEWDIFWLTLPWQETDAQVKEFIDIAQMVTSILELLISS